MKKKVIKEILSTVSVVLLMCSPVFIESCSQDGPKPVEESTVNYGYIALRNTTGVVCQYYVDTPCDTIAGYDYNARISQFNETQDTLWLCGGTSNVKIMQVRPDGYYVNITTEYTVSDGDKYLHDFTPPKQ
jgi:hypothetical protein